MSAMNIVFTSRNSVLIFLSILLFHNAFCQDQGHQNCRRNNLHTSTCKKWNECAKGREMIQKRKAIFCGFENSVPKLCCPPATTVISSVPSSPITLNNRKNAVAVAQKKCTEYAKYRFTNITIRGELVGDPDTIFSASECVTVEELIVDGSPAEPKEYPHMALIGYGSSLSSVQWLCGGSLISERFVLSAAHCSVSSVGAAKWVLLGDLDIFSQTDDARPKIYEIVRTYDHPNYRKNAVYDDITLFRLNTTVEFSPYVRPACLDTSTSLPSDNYKVSVTGWGTTGTIDPSSDYLQKATIFVVNNERCLLSYKNDNHLPRGFDSKSMICAGDTKGKDTCKGDSGGPLQVPIKESFCMWNQLGVTSYGPGLCGDKETPAIYTKVSNYIEWIQQIVWP